MQNSMTIILNNKMEKDFKAILNLKKNEKSLIKFYNGNVENRNFALGIKQNDKISKIPLNINNKNSEFVIPGEIKLDEKFLCAVVDVTNAFCPEIILSGSSNSINENQIIENSFVQTKPANVDCLYEFEDEEKVLDIIEENITDDYNTKYYDECRNCKYKKAFYDDGCKCCSEKSKNEESLVESSELHEELIENKSINNIDKNIYNINEVNKKGKEESEVNTGKFYLQVKNQIDELFEKYSNENVLESIIPDSKWVKVNYDNDKDYYVVGLIYIENKVEFICYGVPSLDSKSPPEDIKNYAQWLPVDVNKPDAFGYWICYQKAENGESVIINYV